MTVTPSTIFTPWRARALLALAFLLHFGLGAGMGLSVDEAHYLLYALHPALSYFDHPPLVGWVQWPWVALNAPTAVLRLVPGVLWLASAWIAYQLTVRLHGAGVSTTAQAAGAVAPATSAPAAHQAGLWTLVALALAPLLHVLGIGLLPDTLLMFFVLALMWQTLTLMQPRATGHATAQGFKPGALAPVQRLLPWLGLGVLLGLAGLSKYTAILPAAAVALCLLGAHGWRLLRNPWLWLGTLLALAMVMPVAVWNAQNQWISFTYQARHGAGSTWQTSHVLRFLLVQLLVYGPLLWWGFSAGRQWVARSHRLLLAFFFIPFGVLAALSGGGSSLPHWTAPAWVALAPFAGLGLARMVSPAALRLRTLCMALQALVCVLMLGLMLSAGQPLLGGTGANVPVGSNPFADLHGWDRAGQRVRELAAQQRLDRVAVQNWTLASRLGWYARPLPVQVLEDRFDQFDLWAGDLAPGGSALLVDWSHMAYTLPLGVHGFASCALLDTQEVSRFGVAIASFRFYACHGWAGDPRPRLQLGE